MSEATSVQAEPIVWHRRGVLRTVAAIIIPLLLVILVSVRWRTSATSTSLPSEFVKAWEALEMERVDEAEKNIESLMRQRHYGNAYLVLDAFLSVYHGDFEAAEKRIQLTNPTGTIRPYALEVLGRSLYGQQRWYDAERAFATLAAEYPQNFMAHFWLGVVYHDLHMFGQAVHELQLATNLRPQDSRPRILLGSILARRARYHAAIEQYQHALRSMRLDAKFNAASSSPLIASLVNCLVRDGQYEEALEQIALVSEPSVEMQKLRADCFLGLGQLTEAERECRMVLERDEYHHGAVITLVNIGLQTAVTVEHTQLLEAVLATNPNHPEATYLLAQIYGRLGNQQRQQELLSQSQRVTRLHVRIRELMDDTWSQPDNVNSRLELAAIFDELGDSNQAKQWRQAAVGCRNRVESIKANQR